MRAGWIKRKGVTYNQRLLGFDQVHFTRHALDRMKQRRITKADVYYTAEHPDETGLPTRTGRHRVRWRKADRWAIDVVYELQSISPIRIITAMRIDLFAEKGTPPTIVRIRGKVPGSKRRKKPRQRKPQKRGRQR